MKDTIQIALFTVVVSLMYTAIAQVLPQLDAQPPAEVALGSNIGPEELAPIGAEAFKGPCTACHKIGESGRAPDLGNIGAIAADRAAERAAKTGKPFTDVDYLLEALCKPGDYLVEGYGNIMPPQQKALSGGQILAIVAYLQSMGGEASVRGTDVEAVLRFGCATSGGAAPAEAESSAEALGTPEQIYTTFGCSGCHSIDSDERKIGPSLFGIGKRMNKGEIYEGILAPDAVIAKGDPPFAGGTMKTTLDGNGFYQKMTPGDYQALVDWLAANKGEE
ncbi:MAG: cytochrome c2 [Myxococcota bacterium]